MAPQQQNAKPRPYRSAARDAGAERTRAAVIAAARRLFGSSGFRGTTIAAIAREAAVSQQTVYAAFGSKAAVLRAILEQMEETAEAAHWRARIAAEDDPATMLSAFAHWTEAFVRASDASLAAAWEAGPELAELAAQGDAHRRAALTELFARIAGAGALRPGLEPSRAVDRAWIFTGVQTYVQAVEGCGWSGAEYAEWLGATLAEQTLGEQWMPPNGDTGRSAG